jgi:hypothetical protein
MDCPPGFEFLFNKPVKDVSAWCLFCTWKGKLSEAVYTHPLSSASNKEYACPKCGDMIKWKT